MEWPFFRRRGSSGSDDERRSPVGSEGWSRLPPIESILPPLEGTDAITGFVGGLTARRPLPLALRRLEHLISKTAPSGIVPALALVGARRPRRLGRRSEASRGSRREARSMGTFPAGFEEPEPPTEEPAPPPAAPEVAPTLRRPSLREPASSRAAREPRRALDLRAELGREPTVSAPVPGTIDAQEGRRDPPAGAGPAEGGERPRAVTAADELRVSARRESVESHRIATARETGVGAPERVTSPPNALAEPYARAVPRRLQPTLPSATTQAAERAEREETDEMTAPRLRLTAVAWPRAEPLASSVASSLRPARGAVAAEPLSAIPEREPRPAAHPVLAAAEDLHASAADAAGPAPSASAPPQAVSPPTTPLPASAEHHAAEEAAAPPGAVQVTAAPTAAGAPPAPDLETLADDLYEHLRARLTQELVLDRERTLFTPELR